MNINKEFKYSTSQKANHSRWCDKNLKKKEYLKTLRNNIHVSKESRKKQSNSLKNDTERKKI